MQMSECHTSKTGQHTANPLLKNFITDKRKMSTKFMVSNNKTLFQNSQSFTFCS